MRVFLSHEATWDACRGVRRVLCAPRSPEGCLVWLCPCTGALSRGGGGTVQGWGLAPQSSARSRCLCVDRPMTAPWGGYCSPLGSCPSAQRWPGSPSEPGTSLHEDTAHTPRQRPSPPSARVAPRPLVGLWSGLSFLRPHTPPSIHAIRSAVRAPSDEPPPSTLQPAPLPDPPGMSLPPRDSEPVIETASRSLRKWTALDQVGDSVPSGKGVTVRRVYRPTCSGRGEGVHEPDTP